MRPYLYPSRHENRCQYRTQRRGSMSSMTTSKTSLSRPEDLSNLSFDSRSQLPYPGCARILERYRTAHFRRPFDRSWLFGFACRCASSKRQPLCASLLIAELWKGCAVRTFAIIQALECGLPECEDEQSCPVAWFVGSAVNA